MMRPPAAARAVGATDIDVEPWLKLQFAKPPDADGRSRARCKHEGIGSWLGLHHVSDGISFVLWIY
jgi:hypothetical protein